MASLGFVLGVISPHFVLGRSIFSSICIGNILCIYIVVVKIRRQDSKIFIFSLESVRDRPEAFRSSHSIFPNFPVEKVNLWSDAALDRLTGFPLGDRPEVFSSSRSIFLNFPVEKVNLWSDTASSG